MKLRFGFVSNSSSSAFIVGFSRGKFPRSVKEMQKMLFGNQKVQEIYDKQASTEAIAAQVWNDFQKTKPLTESEMAKELEHADVWDGFPREFDLDDFKRDSKEGVALDSVAWDQYELELAKRGADIAAKLLHEHPGLDFFSFTYGDDDGDFGCVMEHGGTFDNLFHVKVSHH